MTFAQLGQGASVFLDANTLIYHFSQHPVLASPCTQLLDRISRQELLGFTSADVLRDTAHRLMVLEASTVLGWTGTGLTSRLQKHAGEIQKLVRFQQAIQEIPHLGVQVLSVTFSLVEAATVSSRRFGLLSGDALVVAIMQHHGLTNLASNDADFDRVAGITRYAPV
ncbi:MAG: type II toxin-antitoxin system VapC family toxin [Planctomycetes bacterium]|nr:type II toxin-antitoxin system VapC family toxin [Planctomycetota bacterium]